MNEDNVVVYNKEVDEQTDWEKEISEWLHKLVLREDEIKVKVIRPQHVYHFFVPKRITWKDSAGNTHIIYSYSTYVKLVKLGLIPADHSSLATMVWLAQRKGLNIDETS